MTTLVTGGTGLVGSLAARKLLERGEKVVLYDVAPQVSFLGDIIDSVTVIRGDILDFPDLLRALRQESVDRIIHTAGILGPAASARPYTTVKINAVGTANIYEASRLEGIRRVVFCSSGTIYDSQVPCVEPVTEEFPLGPRTVYASTKLFGENMARNYREIYGLDVITVRFASVYGSGGSLGGAANVLLQALVDGPVLGRPAVVRRPAMDAFEFLHAGDAAKGTVLACLAEKPEHTVFNIGTGRLTSYDELVGLVREMVPGAIITVHEADLSGYHRLYKRDRYEPYNISRAQRELGYVPDINLKTGLTEYIQSVKQRARKS